MNTSSSTIDSCATGNLNVIFRGQNFVIDTADGVTRNNLEEEDKPDYELTLQPQPPIRINDSVAAFKLPISKKQLDELISVKPGNVLAELPVTKMPLGSFSPEGVSSDIARFREDTVMFKDNKDKEAYFNQTAYDENGGRIVKPGTSREDVVRPTNLDGADVNRRINNVVKAVKAGQSFSEEAFDAQGVWSPLAENTK